MSDWKSGDLATAHDGRVIYRRARNGLWNGFDAEGYAYTERNIDGVARPLVVIDPESSDDLDNLCKALVEKMHAAGDRASAANGVHPATMQAALREFAAPKPPRPEEPMETFAQVVDFDGHVWCRMPEGGWKRDNGNFVAHYDLIGTVVEVLS